MGNTFCNIFQSLLYLDLKAAENPEHLNPTIRCGKPELFEVASDEICSWSRSQVAGNIGG